MDAKKFFKKNIIIGIGLIFLGIVYSRFYNTYIDSGKAKFYSFNNLKNNSIKLVILGNSHTRWGIKSSKEDILNLALGSQNYYYDLKVLKQYSNKIQKNATVIIPISILSFYKSGEKELNNYIGILPKNELKNVSLKDYFLLKYFSGFFPITNLYKAKDYFIEIIKKKEIYKNFSGYPKDFNMNLRIKENKKGVKDHLMNRDIIQEKEFLELLEYIYINEWHIILITTPFSYLYNNEIERIEKEAFKVRIYNNIEEVEKKIGKKFIYFDYSHDKRFENKLEYFFDDDHLNEKGAEYFTNILLNDIGIN